VVLQSFRDRVEIVTVSVPLPIAWSHPTFTGIKLVISVVFHHLPLFIPTAVKIEPPTGLSLSFGTISVEGKKETTCFLVHLN
jgi:hypothetical protein